MTSVGAALTEWLPAQRWYGGKGRPVRAISVERSTPLAPTMTHLVVAVDYADRDGSRDANSDRDYYQVLLHRASDALAHLDHALIGVDGDEVLYDALHDGSSTGALLDLMRTQAHPGELTFTTVSEDLPDAPGIVVGVEQSNTSVVYGDELILKVFRRLGAGVNPDLELTRALADAGSPHVATPVGWITGRIDGAPTTLALLQRYLKTGTEGWKLATASVRDLYAEGDLHADEVGGDFAAESERLGVATAEVHALLADLLPSGPAPAEAAVLMAEQMQERLRVATLIVPALADYRTVVSEAYAAVAEVQGAVHVQRIHGDYHLGQVLRTDSGWVLLDFEGEPARPLAERTAQASPLRDVAGMLRSYDYAARSLLADHPGQLGLEYRAREWEHRNREAFCDGYESASGRDPRMDSVLLRAFELDKAVYEVCYEARHRPSWLPIPLGSIERLAG